MRDVLPMKLLGAVGKWKNFLNFLLRRMVNAAGGYHHKIGKWKQTFNFLLLIMVQKIVLLLAMLCILCLF